jgi:hypothetical protein
MYQGAWGVVNTLLSAEESARKSPGSSREPARRLPRKEASTTGRKVRRRKGFAAGALGWELVQEPQNGQVWQEIQVRIEGDN